MDSFFNTSNIFYNNPVNYYKLIVNLIYYRYTVTIYKTESMWDFMNPHLPVLQTLTKSSPSLFYMCVSVCRVYTYTLPLYYDTYTYITTHTSTYLPTYHLIISFLLRFPFINHLDPFFIRPPQT